MYGPVIWDSAMDFMGMGTCNDPEIMRMVREHNLEDVVKDVIRESMQEISDMGFCSLTYDDDGKIDGIHINSEQGKRMIAYQAYVKGGEA